MPVKINTARTLLGAGPYQVSTEAAALLALHLDGLGRDIAGRALASLATENECRAAQGLEPRRRITADDIRRALV